MNKANANLMTQAEYARHRGCTRPSVHRAIASGRISCFGPEKLIDADLADAQWARNTRARVGSMEPAPEQAAPDTDRMSYAEAKRREAVADALMAERAAAVQAGTLLPADDVRRVWAGFLVAARQTLETMPDRVAPLIVTMSAHEAFVLLRGEVHSVLTNLARSDGVGAEEPDRSPGGLP